MHRENEILHRLDRIANDNARIGRIKPKAELFALMRHALGDHVRFREGRYYELWKYGRWVPASLTAVMQEVNRWRVSKGYVQITSMPGWRV